MREKFIMERLREASGVCKLIDVVRDSGSHAIALVGNHNPRYLNTAPESTIGNSTQR